MTGLPTGHRPIVEFASPRRLPRANRLEGRVVVLDIAFASEGLGKGFDKVTGRFIEALGPRLAAWVDHHDHPRHAEFARDSRFVLFTKAEHGACPEIITPELVRQTGPVDTILAHFDLDGIYAAAKWMLGGYEPYPGADDDARAVDTRIGEVSVEARSIDRALRAHYREPALKQQILNYLVSGLNAGPDRDAIEVAERDYERLSAGAHTVAARYDVDRGIALVRLEAQDPASDKTELLLLGQDRAAVAVVIDADNVSIAAGFESGIDFVELLELGGGMPTRVNVPYKRLDDSLNRIRRRLVELGINPES